MFYFQDNPLIIIEICKINFESHNSRQLLTSREIHAEAMHKVNFCLAIKSPNISLSFIEKGGHLLCFLNLGVTSF